MTIPAATRILILAVLPTPAFAAGAVDDSLIDANKTLIEAGPIGAVCVLLIAGIIFLTRQWMKTTAAVLAEKQARLDDQKDQISLGIELKNVLLANTQAAQANTVAVQQLVEASRNWGRKGS